MPTILRKIRSLHFGGRRKRLAELHEILDIAHKQDPEATSYRRLVSWPGRMVIEVRYEPFK